MSKIYKVALAGNPNCGKTTIFNLLTGAHQHVGNYSGVTIERKTGRFSIGDVRIELVDLPGTYSLSRSSSEEKVALDELLRGDIDLVLNIIDSGNAQRNLYLTTQIAELGLPMLLVFNMADDAREQGLRFNYKLLSRFFGAPAVEMVGSSGAGLNRLKVMLRRVLGSPAPQRPNIANYGKTVSEAIAELADKISRIKPAIYAEIPDRYFAIKLLERDPVTAEIPEFTPLAADVKAWNDRFIARYGTNESTLFADRRYGIIAGACREAITKVGRSHRHWSDQVDKVVTSRYLGLPIFLLLMYLMFVFTFTAAEPLVELAGWLVSRFAEGIGQLWPQDFWPFLRDMVLRGIIPGVGGVLIFLPNILTLFLALSILEGTGYMARAAFIMDGFMHHFELHGKSFIPMVMGFGCSVPAVMATRTIESERDRLTTIMVLPFISCGARLPIYALLIPVFFAPRYQPLVLFLLYLVGVLVALVVARVLKRTLFSGDDEVFVMELPPYRLPTVRSIAIHLYERLMMYLKKAGTFILAASIILFILSSYPESPENTPPAEAQQHTVVGRVGSALAVIMKPLGFQWQESAALIGAFAGKELFVSQMSILCANSVGEGNESLTQEILRNSGRTPLQGFCIMLFCLLSMPCVATVAVVKKETNSWKLALLQLVGMTTIAYVVTLAVYQIGRLIFY